jgi:hypothetical protein
MDPTASQVRFCTLHAIVLNIILLGNLPRKIAECFCDSQVIAIPKNNNDIRPINIICSLRQIVENVAQSYLRKKWADHFGYTQLGLKSCGTEFIAHEFQIQFESSQKYFLLFAYFINMIQLLGSPTIKIISLSQLRFNQVSCKVMFWPLCVTILRPTPSSRIFINL